MEGTKAWYLSKGVVMPVLGLVGIVIGSLGYTFGAEEQEAVMLAITQLSGAFAAVGGVYGRVKASKKIK